MKKKKAKAKAKTKMKAKQKEHNPLVLDGALFIMIKSQNCQGLDRRVNPYLMR